MTASFDAYEVDLHGHRAVYRAAGSGPTVVLIHGMVNSSRHWERSRSSSPSPTTSSPPT